MEVTKENLLKLLPYISVLIAAIMVFHLKATYFLGFFDVLLISIVVSIINRKYKKE